MTDIGAQSYSPSAADSTAYVASAVVKASAGVLMGLSGYNSRTSEQFIQIFDSATVPANGTAPAIVFRVGPESNFSLDLGERGRYMADGIAWSNSSTVATKTLGSADVWMNVLYR